MTKMESPLIPTTRAIGDTREGVFLTFDLARFTGDALSALMLGQILYWFGVGRDGYCRAQVKVKLTEDDLAKGIDPALAEVPWLAKGDEAWFEEVCLTAAQARRVRTVFERDGWIATVTKRFAGTPTTHITILPKLQEELATWYSAPPDERVRRERITLARQSPKPRHRDDADGLADNASRNGLSNDASPLRDDANETCAVSATITDDLQTTSQTTSPPGGADVASDATPSPIEEEPTADREDGPFQVVARGFGYDPVGLPDAIRNKIRASLKAAKAADLVADLNFLAGLVWLFRARGGRDPGKFGSAVAVLALDEDRALLPRRIEAASIVDEALARVSELGGSCKGVTRPEAEYAIAAALVAGYSRGAVKTSMLTASQWTKGTLLNEVGRLGGARSARPSAMVPEGLADLTDRQLVDLLRADPPKPDVERIGAEIAARLAIVSPDQYQRAFEVRGLIDGREGWPRGMGAANKLRMTLGVTLDQWLAANRPSTPAALTRGA